MGLINMSIGKKVDLKLPGTGRGKGSAMARLGNWVWQHVPMIPALQRLGVVITLRLAGVT